MRERGALTITLWLLFVLACGFIAARTTFTADLSAFLPSDPSANQQLFIEQLQDGIVSRLILIGIEGEEGATLARLSKRMAQQLRATSNFISVNNGEPINAERDRDYLFTHRYALSPAVNQERFTAAGLRQAIEESIDLLASPAGLLLKPLLTRDPTGETVQLLERFSTTARPKSFQGVWVAPEGNRALLLAQTQAAGADTPGQEEAITLIQSAFAAAVKEEGAATARLLLTGPGVFSVTSRDAIKREVRNLSILSTVIIITLLLIIYRSFTVLALGTLPIATGIVAGIAAVSLDFGTVHSITLGFGITLMGEAVDYPIYLFIQSTRERRAGGQQAWLATFWPTIRLGVMASVIGFIALLFSAFPGLAQLGLYSTVGLIVAALVTRFLLPVLLPRNFQIRDVTHFGKALMLLSHHALPLRWITAALVVAACIITYHQRHDLWNSDLSALSPISAAD
ncbi:MAG: hypothetical protein FD130_757, partial [Halothiobacillaceae bacterium]